MSDMKCPFCKKELKLIGEKSDSGYPIDEYFCGCPQTAFHFGNTPMWNELRVLHEKLEERKESCKVAEKELIRTRKALEFITRISGAGMSYQDMFLDAHEVAKFALGQVKHPVLMGRYDKKMTGLLRGAGNE